MILDHKGKVEAYNEFCSTDVEIKVEAMEVHNITPDMLEGKPLAKETSFYQKLERLNNPENYLIAIIYAFDLRNGMKNEGFLNSYSLIDTLRCAKHLFPDMPYHRLQYLRYAL